MQELHMHTNIYHNAQKQASYFHYTKLRYDSGQQRKQLFWLIIIYQQ